MAGNKSRARRLLQVKEARREEKEKSLPPAKPHKGRERDKEDNRPSINHMEKQQITEDREGDYPRKELRSHVFLHTVSQHPGSEDYALFLRASLRGEHSACHPRAMCLLAQTPGGKPVLVSVSTDPAAHPATPAEQSALPSDTLFYGYRGQSTGLPLQADSKCMGNASSSE